MGSQTAFVIYNFVVFSVLNIWVSAYACEVAVPLPLNPPRREAAKLSMDCSKASRRSFMLVLSLLIFGSCSPLQLVWRGM